MVAAAVALGVSGGTLEAIGVPTKLVFTTEPVGGPAGSPLTTQPVVKIEDANGNVVPEAASTVTLTLKPGTSASGSAAVLEECSGGSAVSGVATFSACVVTEAGAGYELDATDGTLARAESTPFTVTASRCAGTVVGAGASQQTPGAGKPCWVEVNPYPFGANGLPADPALCLVTRSSCETVTSLAFRAWNRGLAATTGGPFGVWLYNGTRWFPDPTFPGPTTCPGGTVLWAGKLDYWLIGNTDNSWQDLCRFDGVNEEWESFKVPTATLADVPHDASGQPDRGGITSGACFSFDNCWFFGDWGTVVHWDGTQLADATPDLSQATGEPWLNVDYTAAETQVDASGNDFGVAVAKSTVGGGGSIFPARQIALRPGGNPPAQLFTSTGSTWETAAFTPPAVLPAGDGSDPYLTDLTAVDFAPGGLGWAAGNPAAASNVTNPNPDPAPLIPLVPLGQDPGCTAVTSLAGSGTGTDLYQWASIATIGYAGADDAYAGGFVRPVGGSQVPVLVEVTAPNTSTNCAARVMSTVEFPVVDGEVTAVVASAPNAGWTATTAGTSSHPAPPHLYELTDGTPPDAPAGNDAETRPLNLQQNPPIIEFEPLPPPPAPPPAAAAATPVVSPAAAPAPARPLPPAISGIAVKLKTKTKRIRTHVRIHGRRAIETKFDQSFTLDLTFKVVRPVTIGLDVVHKGRTVASTGLKRFGRGGRGLLSLPITRAQWPTSLAFITDQPHVSLLHPGPGAKLAGTVSLTASAKALSGRKITAIEFEYAPTGTNTWTPIASANAAPFTASFNTSFVPNGTYALRVIATDNAGVTGVSTVVADATVHN